MNCQDCEHYAIGDCAGKTDRWEERVAICTADGISEERAMEVACEEERGKRDTH